MEVLSWLLWWAFSNIHSGHRALAAFHKPLCQCISNTGSVQVTLWFSLREVGLNSEILVPWLDIILWIIQPIDSRKWWYHCVQIVGEKQVFWILFLGYICFQD